MINFCNPDNLCNGCPLNEIDPEQRAEYSRAVNNVLGASSANLFVHGEHEEKLEVIYNTSGFSDETLTTTGSPYITTKTACEVIARGLCEIAGRNPLGRMLSEAELNE